MAVLLRLHALLPLFGLALFFQPVVLSLLLALGGLGLLRLHPLGMVGLALALLGGPGGSLCGAGPLRLLQRCSIWGRLAGVRLQRCRGHGLGLLGFNGLQAGGGAFLALLLV